MTRRDAHPWPSDSPNRALPARPAELLDIVPCALMEVSINAVGRRSITYFSAAATEMYGYSRSDMLGRDPAFLSAGTADEVSRWRASFNETGQWRQTTKHIARDGRLLDVELNGLAWRDEEGQLAGYLLAVRDITAETARTRRLDEQAALLELAPNAILARDMNRRITLWNRAAEEMYGYARAQVIGRRPKDVLHTRYPIPLDDIERIVADTGRWEGDLIHVRRDGEEITVASTWGAFHDGDGRIIGLLEINRDITERLALQAERERMLASAERLRLSERLVRSQRLESLGQLAGGIAHDFNNLLAVIAGYTTALTEGVEELGPALPAPAHAQLIADLGEVARASRQASDLTHQLLAFARQETVRSEPVSLNDVVADLRELIARTIGEHVQLETELDPELLRVQADPGQMGQVLINLAVNARDAMPAGGRLSVQTHNLWLDADDARERGQVNAGWHVELVVTDTGAGMTREVMEHAFDPFYTTKGPGEGTGLGLATVYGIITGARGALSLYSEPGQGTTLRALLPALDAEDPPARPAEVEEPPRARSRQTILVVEDQAPLRAITARILSRAGYTVLTAGSGPEALTVAAQSVDPIDVLLTDVVMPEMLGTMLAQTMLVNQPELKVVFTSGFARPALEHGGRALEGPLLQKPVPAAELLRQVAAVLAG
jgi:two-component system cell cycle sensor histidine kinase/response regulator CckA